MKKKYRILLPVGFFLILAAFFFHPSSFRLYEQTFANTATGPFVMGHIIGEEFNFTLPNISRVDIRVATYSRRNDSLLTCYIMQGGRILATRTVDSANFRDNEVYSIHFRPVVPLQPDEDFTVFFETNAEWEEDNYVALYFSDRARSRYSHFFINETAHPDKNLWIRLYSQMRGREILGHFFREYDRPARVLIPAFIMIVMGGVLWKVAITSLAHDKTTYNKERDDTNE